MRIGVSGRVDNFYMIHTILNPPFFLYLYGIKIIEQTMARYRSGIIEHVKEAVEICEIGAYTPGELEAYDKYWDAVSMDRTLRDNLAETTQALEEERLERKKATQALAETTQSLAEKDQALAEMTQAFAESQKRIESLQNR
jgi:GrpB-like predicted nucleotidyltransferase (UPF0157 family)